MNIPQYKNNIKDIDQKCAIFLKGETIVIDTNNGSVLFEEFIKSSS